MDIKSIHSRAPTRIDLAGGTLDIWPLYLFLSHPVTLNLAIDLFAEATIELLPSSGQGHAMLQSADQSKEMKIPWTALQDSPQIPHGLELHFKLLKFFYEKRVQRGGEKIKGDLVLRTLARSPAGAGLGGSSALSIAMIGALATWASQVPEGHTVDPRTDGETFIEIVRDVETTVIQVPAGLQDYYGAMYGGLQSLRWGAGTHSRESLPVTIIDEMEKRILLFYSGQSRNSGINNWALFKGFIDQKDDIRSKFEQISAATHKLEKSLKALQWTDAASAIREEWAVRKTLATGITTPEIDRAFAEALKLAPISGKVCGAGGGGCFFVYLPIDSESQRNELKKEIQKIFSNQGMRCLDFHGVAHGLEVQVTRG